MTSWIEENKKCFVCAETSEQVCLLSTNVMGSPDLDLRPPEMKRSTIDMQIQCCPTCGYCAPDISDGPSVAARAVKSEEYVAERTDAAYPECARQYLCWARILSTSGDYDRAGWAALSAAWVCDDAGASAEGRTCRGRALALFEQAQAHGLPFAEDSGVEAAILADLLRRRGRFDKVDAVCREGLGKTENDLVEAILRFQQVLARGQDEGCYTVADALQR